MTPAPPAFDRPQRLHPLSLVYRLLTSLPYIVVLLVPLFGTPDAQQWVGAAFAYITRIVDAFGIGWKPSMLDDTALGGKEMD